MRWTLVLFTGLLGVCSLREARAQPARTPPLPPPATLCLVAPGAAPRVVVATPSLAGMYDPRVTPLPEHLNWTVPGVGCVRWPSSATPRIACSGDGAVLPRTERTLCQQ
jgi:hypothetical protein